MQFLRLEIIFFAGSILKLEKTKARTSFSTTQINLTSAPDGWVGWGQFFECGVQLAEKLGIVVMEMYEGEGSK